ncbi:hypothetical protein [Methylocystis parvus]|uniref:hypothetical protein n=1 Tax=Methylocystis parvus TaxID=134 RepID=UPI003C7772D3
MTRVFRRSQFTASALLALLAATAARAETFESDYTSLQDCAPAPHLKLPSRTIEQGAFRCDGVAGYSVYVVDDDPRSFLVVERGDKLYSLEKPMVGAFAPGDFPNVVGAKKAEWRLDASGKAVGLIVRVSYLRKESGGAASALMAFDLRGAAPALIGVAGANEEARLLVDNAAGSVGAARIKR